MLSGVILARKSTYSSVWNCAISFRVAGFARWLCAVSADMKELALYTGVG